MTVGPPGWDRCPTCSAAVKPGDPWCTLCYADLRPPAPVEPAPATAAALPVAAPEPAHQPPAPDALSSPLEVGAAPTWPCTTCQTPNAMDRSSCAACGAPFLSGLREQDGPLLELPVVGDITRLGRGQRFALAAGVVLVFVVLTVLVGLLFG